jgi:hypothetical protein
MLESDTYSTEDEMILHTVDMGPLGRLYRITDLPGELPGNWYYGVGCAYCSKNIAVMEDTLKSKSVSFCGDGAWVLACPHCGQADAYKAHTIIHFEVPLNP